MKNIFKNILLGVGLLSMVSCSDFLDQTSPSEVDNDGVQGSIYFMELVLNKAYGELTLDETYSQYIPIIWGLNSDCELVDGLGNDATNRETERGNMNYNANPGWANLARLWDGMYSIIESTNSVIHAVDNSEFILTEGNDKKKVLRYKGEAMTLRAMIYSDLIKFFGDIPMHMDISNSDLSNVYIPKTDRDIILDRLIEDLKEVIENEYLPWAGESGSTTERMTRGYAHSLLANIALSRAGWHIRESAKEGYETATGSDGTYPTQRCDAAKRKEMYELAEKHLSAVITSGVHQLNPSIENHWYLINQRTLDHNYKENIFEIPMGLGRSSELGYTVGIRMNGSSTKYGQKGNSSGKLKLTAPYLYSFDSKDLRRDLTCAPYELKESENILKEEMQGNNPFQIYCAKWDIRKMNEEWRASAIAAAEAKWMSGINVVRMRYPQVLLMYAEVVNELYSNPDATGLAGITARKALEEVHTRAFNPEDKPTAKDNIDNIATDDFFDAIVQENAWELAGEGFRKFDLIRWNLLSQKIEEFKSTYKDQVENTYPEKLYYKYKADGASIDMSSIHWYEVPADITGYEVKNFYGYEKTQAADKQTQLNVNLPSISSGLNAEVKNRYLLPIASSTISNAKGMFHNSYGYKD